MTTKGEGLAEFLAEAQEVVDHLTSTTLAVDQSARKGDVDPDLVNTFFRDAHSLKGLAGMFGQTEIAALAHHFENALDGLRLGRLRLDRDNLDLFFETIETLGAMLAVLASGEPHGRDVKALEVRLDSAQRTKTPWQKGALPRLPFEPAVLEVLSEYEEHRLRENIARAAAILAVRASYPITQIENGLSDLRGRLKAVGEVVATLPAPAPGDEAKIDFTLIVATKEGDASVRAAIEGIDANVAPLATVAATEPMPSAAAANETGPTPSDAKRQTASTRQPSSTSAREGDALPVSLRSVSQTVRVDIGRLDRLMNIVGELVLAKAGILRVIEQLRAETALAPVAAELHREYRILERRVGELREGLLEVRMVPLGTVFEKLTRVARSISKVAGKDVEVFVAGAETEIDKLIVEDLSDPLMHMLRNCIDHGIEPPEARSAAGKPAKGRVELRAYQKGNHVVIEVSDDGGGIDPESLRRAAVERGVITSSRAAEMSDRDALNLVFLPGFSTKREVSELSGRGVGLDVVKNNIAKLSGVIDIASETGRGTRFTITLPITLAILPSLIVRVAGQRFAVPLASVLESATVAPEAIHRVGNHEVMSLRGSTLPLLRVAEALGIGATRPVTSAEPFWYVVVVGIAELRLGLLVDDLVGQQDVIIKALGQLLSGARGIAGATELGNQEPVLVLDVAALVEETLRKEAAA